MFENLHQIVSDGFDLVFTDIECNVLQVTKRPYRGSNKRARDISLFIFKWHERHLLLSIMREFANSRESKIVETYWTQVIMSITSFITSDAIINQFHYN